MFETTRLLLIFLFAVLLRWCVTYHAYSGEGKAPMFGDYEAQRHWQEITFNLPCNEWYTNSTNNDLQYWGLDYPPLTAYHSMLLGYVANGINPDYVKLHDSRGYESEGHKFFMRMSVVLADIAVYIPAIFCFLSRTKIDDTVPNPRRKDSPNILDLGKRHCALIAALIYPGLILIDHGHFQYNCVSLGLFVAALNSVLHVSPLLGSALFVSALNYKQMELYHSLPFFFYILGSNLRAKGKREFTWTLKFGNLFLVASVVLITFGVIWTPFLRSFGTLSDVVIRLFPLGRGIFEDKVANVWCSVNVLYKLRKAFTDLALAKVCLVATLAAVLPGNFDLFLKPTGDKFILSLVNTSLGFFLFSFQVHEKSILLVAVPVLLQTHKDPLPSLWFLIISNFSMLHLYLKDHLALAYFGVTVFYLVAIYFMFSDIFSARGVEGDGNKPRGGKSAEKFQSGVKNPRIRGSVEVAAKSDSYSYLVVKLFQLSMIGMILLTVGMLAVDPPKRYPDLFPVLLSLYSCAHFVGFFVYFNYRQIMGDRSSRKVKSV